MSLLRTWLLLGLPLVLSQCGSRQDLIIGEVAAISSPDTGSAGKPETPATAGSAGSAGASGAAGSEPTTMAGAGATAGAGGADVEAGAGGIGDPPTPEDCVPGSEPPLGSLRHRYSFEGSGTVATDSISGRDGQLVDAKQDNGLVTMNVPAPKREFVDLPDDIVSNLTDVTVVAWATWKSGAAYQRFFDFGADSNHYFAVIPKTGFDEQTKSGLGAELKAPGFGTIQLASTELMKDRYAQVALSFQGGVRAALYLDGTLLVARDIKLTLGAVTGNNNRIGLSQYATDPVYEGNVDEVRIYDTALNGCQLHTLLVRGAQLPFPP